MFYTEPIKDVKPDNRKRVHLGELTDNVDGFKVFKDEQGRLVLEPYADVPLHQMWVFENTEVLASLDRADAQLKEGKSSRMNWDEWETGGVE